MAARAEVAAALAVEAAAVNPVVEFYQRLLAAELSVAKRQVILKDLGASPSVGALLAHPALTPAERDRVKGANLDLLAKAQQHGVSLLADEDLPRNLRDAAPGATPALFCWGNPGVLNEPCIAIVGTRQASTYGKAVAQKFAEAFARAGVTVVSGGAFGIDAAAHKGALAAGGHTAAVLLTGIERTYPLEHRGLFQQIRGSGCLVSQFAVGVGQGKYHPIVRNHTIAALCLGVVLVEVPARSGAITTAHAANDLGRQVFVVPANIDNESFRGSHAMIRDGATLVDHPDQVLDALGIIRLTSETPEVNLSDLARTILSVLSVNPTPTDIIIEQTGLSSSDILAELTMMELEGHVIRDRTGYALKP